MNIKNVWNHQLVAIDSIFSLYVFCDGPGILGKIKLLWFIEPIDLQKSELHNHWKSKDHEHK